MICGLIKVFKFLFEKLKSILLALWQYVSALLPPVYKQIFGFIFSITLQITLITIINLIIDYFLGHPLVTGVDGMSGPNQFDHFMYQNAIATSPNGHILPHNAVWDGRATTVANPVLDSLALLSFSIPSSLPYEAFTMNDHFTMYVAMKYRALLLLQNRDAVNTPHIDGLYYGYDFLQTCMPQVSLSFFDSIHDLFPIVPRMFQRMMGITVIYGQFYNPRNINLIPIPQNVQPVTQVVNDYQEKKIVPFCDMVPTYIAVESGFIHYITGQYPVIHDELEDKFYFAQYQNNKLMPSSYLTEMQSIWMNYKCTSESLQLITAHTSRFVLNLYLPVDVQNTLIVYGPLSSFMHNLLERTQQSPLVQGHLQDVHSKFCKKFKHANNSVVLLFLLLASYKLTDYSLIELFRDLYNHNFLLHTFIQSYLAKFIGCSLLGAGINGISIYLNFWRNRNLQAHFSYASILPTFVEELLCAIAPLSRAIVVFVEAYHKTRFQICSPLATAVCSLSHLIIQRSPLYLRYLIHSLFNAIAAHL